MRTSPARQLRRIRRHRRVRSHIQDKNETEITERARKINRLESEADTIYRAIISDLFDGTHEAVEIIRWKEIMETMEETADQAERVGNLIKEVVMKYA